MTWQTNKNRLRARLPAIYGSNFKNWCGPTFDLFLWTLSNLCRESWKELRSLIQESTRKKWLSRLERILSLDPLCWRFQTMNGRKSFPLRYWGDVFESNCRKNNWRRKESCSFPTTSKMTSEETCERRTAISSTCKDYFIFSLKKIDAPNCRMMCHKF